MKKEKNINKKKMWAYYAPDGYLQSRSLSETRKDSREAIARREPDVTWRDYEREGYKLHRVEADIRVLAT